MSEWSGQSKGTPIGYKIFIIFLKYLPLWFAYFIAWFVALYFFFFTEKTHIANFYKQAFKLSGKKLRKYIFSNFYTFSKVILDRISILAGFKSNFTFEYEGEEHLINLGKGGAGGFIIGAHAGNWEVAGKLFTRLNTPVHILMYDGERSEIKEIIERTTGGKAFNVIYIKENDISHIYAINEAIKKGELIAMHGDRFLSGNKSHECDFFGKTALFPTGPYYLASSLKAPVCFVSTMKEGRKHYHFYATPPEFVQQGKANRKTLETDVKIFAEKYAKNLENTLRKYPLQWFNYYNFWNSNN